MAAVTIIRANQPWWRINYREIWAYRDLLWFLMHRRNRVLTRDFLLQHVWGYEQGLDLSTKVIDVTLSHLRDKLGSTANKIVAVRGFGYRFDD